MAHAPCRVLTSPFELYGGGMGALRETDCLQATSKKRALRDPSPCRQLRSKRARRISIGLTELSGRTA